MEIMKEKISEKLIVKLVGKLDTTTAPELRESLKDDLSDVKELIIDMADLFYISSAGLRVILLTQKLMNKQGTMKIINVQDIVMEIFEATGFVDILTIE